MRMGYGRWVTTRLRCRFVTDFNYLLPPSNNERGKTRLALLEHEKMPEFVWCWSRFVVLSLTLGGLRETINCILKQTGHNPSFYRRYEHLLRLSTTKKEEHFCNNDQNDLIPVSTPESRVNSNELKTITRNLQLQLISEDFQEDSSDKSQKQQHRGLGSHTRACSVKSRCLFYLHLTYSSTQICEYSQTNYTQS